MCPLEETSLREKGTKKNKKPKTNNHIYSYESFLI